MKVVQFFSAWGGVGQTTLVAHLSAALVTAGHKVLAIDLSCGNALASYLSGQTTRIKGWSEDVLTGHWWAASAQQNSEGVQFLPFGEAEPDTEFRLMQLISQNPGWLKLALGQIDLPPDAIVMLDCPQWPNLLTKQAMDVADIQLMCTPLGAPLFHKTGLYEELTQHCDKNKLHALLMRVNPGRPSHAESLDFLRELPDWSVLEQTLHEDDGVGLAQLHAVGVMAAFPHSQYVQDIRNLSDWLIKSLATGREKS